MRALDAILEKEAREEFYLNREDNYTNNPPPLPEKCPQCQGPLEFRHADSFSVALTISVAFTEPFTVFNAFIDTDPNSFRNSDSSTECYAFSYAGAFSDTNPNSSSSTRSYSSACSSQNRNTFRCRIGTDFFRLYRAIFI